MGEAATSEGVDPSRPARTRCGPGWRSSPALASDRPLVLVLSDLHWADDLVLDFVDRLLDRLAGLPGRAARHGPARVRRALAPRARAPQHGHVTSTRSTPTTPTRWLAALLARDAEPSSSPLLRDRSGGNPFFVEELAAMLRESRGDGRPTRSAARPGELPPPCTAWSPPASTASSRPSGVLEDCAVVRHDGAARAVASSRRRDDALDARPSLSTSSPSATSSSSATTSTRSAELTREVAYGTLTKARAGPPPRGLADWLAGERTADDEARSSTASPTTSTAAAPRCASSGTIEGLPDRRRGAGAVASSRWPPTQARNAEIWRSAQVLYDHALPLRRPTAADRRRAAGGSTSAGPGALAEQRDSRGARHDLDDVLEDRRRRARSRAPARHAPRRRPVQGGRPRRARPTTLDGAVVAVARARRRRTASPTRSASGA